MHEADRQYIAMMRSEAADRRKQAAAVDDEGLRRWLLSRAEYFEKCADEHSQSIGGHVIAVVDHFGPTLYLTADKRWVFGKHAHEARVFSDDERKQLADGQEWKPASDIGLNKAGEQI